MNFNPNGVILITLSDGTVLRCTVIVQLAQDIVVRTEQVRPEGATHYVSQVLRIPFEVIDTAELVE